MSDEAIIRAMIIDDEPLGRQKIRRMLKYEPDVQVIAELEGGPDAVEAIRKERPDLVFLDIQMPLQDGFELLKELGDEVKPKIIFVTAFDQYALKAFDTDAVDYLLKPFDRERFEKAMQRARGDIARERSRGVDSRLMQVLHQLKTARVFPDRIVVRNGAHVLFVRTNEIDWVEAAGNYVRIHTTGKAYLLRETMSELLEKLNPDRFVRIHRSTIVNMECIKEMQPWFGGSYVVILTNGQRLSLSRSCRSELSAKLLGRVTHQTQTSSP